MSGLKSFYFVRHGETDWNRKHWFMGAQDIPMNETGWSQVESCIPVVERLGIASIISSPLKRAAEMAERIGEELGRPVTFEDTLKEASWGKYEGKEVDFTDFLYRWHNGDDIATVEPFVDFTTRVAQGLAAALQQPAPVLIVAHGGVFAAIQRVLGHEPTDLGNCEVVEVSPDRIAPVREG